MAAAQVAPAIDGSDEHVEPKIGFFQEAWVQNALPIVTSLVIHVTLIVMGFILIKPYIKAQEVSQEQVFIPDASIVDGDVGGIPNPGLGGDPTRSAASDLVPENTQSDGWNKLPSKSLQAAVLGGAGETASDSMIGIGAGQSLSRGKGVGVGTGDGEGASAPFGVPGGGMGAGPRFMGLGGGSGVKTVAYVCDASGSMMGLPFDLLKIELKKAVDILVPSQAFNICFFQKGGSEPFSKPSMMVANPANKAKAYQWLADMTVSSNSDPIPSLKLMFGQRPQLMYLLTDGAFDDNDAVIAEIKRLNVNKQTRINTIAFFVPDAPASDRKVCEDVLRRIAEENGGKFKVVLTTDLTK
ncbi:MAG: hypothetical protein QOF78_2457 [Phycisphaerales bacterium]|nr:hypothetical protein [Phycisphaerales bacterium]